MQPDQGAEHRVEPVLEVVHEEDLAGPLPGEPQQPPTFARLQERQ